MKLTKILYFTGKSLLYRQAPNVKLKLTKACLLCFNISYVVKNGKRKHLKDYVGFDWHSISLPLGFILLHGDESLVLKLQLEICYHRVKYDLNSNDRLMAGRH